MIIPTAMSEVFSINFFIFGNIALAFAVLKKDGLVFM